MMRAWSIVAILWGVFSVVGAVSVFSRAQSVTEGIFAALFVLSAVMSFGIAAMIAAAGKIAAELKKLNPSRRHPPLNPPLPDPEDGE